jgi:spore maturation protein CgeB
MKLTYLTWGYPHDAEVIRALHSNAITVETLALPQGVQNRNTDDEEAFLDSLRTVSGDIVFSVNFFAVVSDICQRENIPYCCWVLQLPNFDLYKPSVLNPCNYLGVCDSYLVEKLLGIGVSKAFYLPDAVEVEGDIKTTDFIREPCFVARQPEQYLCKDKMSLYAKGYLDAFLHSQRVLYGASILEDGLLNRVYNEVVSANPVPKDILPQMQRLFLADYYLAPACTVLQQDIFMQNFDSIMTIYSNGEFAVCKSEKHPYIDDETERKKIYAKKEFTLILAPHTMHNGIPRDCLEVIAAGGFALCGFQRDYAYFFKNGENLVWFTDMTEFKKAVVRYGNSQDERERVRTAAYQSVAQGHTYRHRIAMMLEMWGKL